MEIYDIVTKLIGPINPIGETNSDNTRYTNLSEIINLVDNLISDINHVANCKNAQEYSISKAGKLATEFLIDLKDYIEIKLK